jgi:hypothetical protein
MAGNDHVIAVSKQGKLLWGSRLMSSRNGVSILGLKGDTLVMINRGFGVFVGNICYADPASVTAINSKTGIIYHSTQLGKDATVRDWVGVGDILYILTPNTIVKYDLVNGIILNSREVDYDLPPFHDFDFLQSGEYYYLKGARQKKSLAEMNPGNVFLHNHDSLLLRIDERLQPRNLIASYYVEVKGKLNDTLDYTLSDDKLYIYKKGVMVLEASERPNQVLKDKFLYMDKSSFIITKLPKL